jgi:hypothetical protein
MPEYERIGDGRKIGGKGEEREVVQIVLYKTCIKKGETLERAFAWHGSGKSIVASVSISISSQA